MVDRQYVFYSLLGLSVVVSATTIACGDDGRGNADGAEADEGGLLMTTNGDGDGDGDGDVDADADADADASTTFDDDENDNTCAKVMVTPQAVPPNVMLVVDASGSMVSNTLEQDMMQVTRWFALHGVVTTLVNTYEGGINFGMQRFPSIPYTQSNQISSCTVTGPTVPVAPNNAAPILSALPPANGMGVSGATPANLGLVTAYTHLKSLPPGPAKYVVFIADGAANCKASVIEANPTNPPIWWSTFDTDVEQTVAQAYADGIPTYVVGIGIKETTSPGDPMGINPKLEMNKIAIAGGFPQDDGDPLTLDPPEYFVGDDAAQIAAAMAAITSELPCEIPLDPAPSQEQVDQDKVKFTLDGNELDFVPDCSPGNNGWTWSVEYTEIRLCGTACDTLKLGNSVFEGEYECIDQG